MKEELTGQRKRNWTKMDEEMEREGNAIRAANSSRAMPHGRGKKVGSHQHRV